jgi:hypothetical protein
MRSKTPGQVLIEPFEGGNMSGMILADFAAVAARAVGALDVVNPDADPHPWFCKNIYRKKDLQWAGYIGPFSEQKTALVFGVNLEFTPAWRKAYPKIKSNQSRFSELLKMHKNYLWHWWGRPGMITRNPEVRPLSPPIWTNQVDVQEWIGELEDILDRKKMWSESIPMRPQIQIMRIVGLPNQLNGSDLILTEIQQTVLDLQPLVMLIGQ